MPTRCAHRPLSMGRVVFFFRTHPRLNLGCVLVFSFVCLCAHLRLNLGCVVFVFVRIPVSTWGAFWFFFCVSLCAPPSQPGVRSFWFCAHLRLNLGCVVTCKNSIIAIITSVDRVTQRSGEIHVHTKTVASHTDRKNADERKEPHQPRG